MMDEEGARLTLQFVNVSVMIAEKENTIHIKRCGRHDIESLRLNRERQGRLVFAPVALAVLYHSYLHVPCRKFPTQMIKTT